MDIGLSILSELAEGRNWSAINGEEITVPTTWLAGGSFFTDGLAANGNKAASFLQSLQEANSENGMRATLENDTPSDEFANAYVEPVPSSAMPVGEVALAVKPLSALHVIKHSGSAGSSTSTVRVDESDFEYLATPDDVSGPAVGKTFIVSPNLVVQGDADPPWTESPLSFDAKAPHVDDAPSRTSQHQVAEPPHVRERPTQIDKPLLLELQTGEDGTTRRQAKHSVQFDDGALENRAPTRLVATASPKSALLDPPTRVGNAREPSGFSILNVASAESIPVEVKGVLSSVAADSEKTIRDETLVDVREPGALAEHDAVESSVAAPRIRGKASPIEQVVRAALDAKADVVEDKPVELRLRLEPPELGVLRIHLKLEHDTVTVKVLIRNDATRQTFEQQLPQLRERFQEAGITFGGFDVGGDRGQSAEQWSARQAHFEWSPMAAPQVTVNDSPRSGPSAPLRANEIDLVA